MASSRAPRHSGMASRRAPSGGASPPLAGSGSIRASTGSPAPRGRGSRTCTRICWPQVLAPSPRTDRRQLSFVCPGSIRSSRSRWRGPTPTKGAGLEVHRVSRVDRVDLALVRDIPSTSPARTLVDLASVVGRDRLGSIPDHAIAREIVDLDRARRRLAAVGTGGRKGRGGLVALVDERSGPSRPARSPLEPLLWKGLGGHR